MTHYFEREGKNEQYHKIDKMDNTEKLDTLENWKKNGQIGYLNYFIVLLMVLFPLNMHQNKIFNLFDQTI